MTFSKRVALPLLLSSMLAGSCWRERLDPEIQLRWVKSSVVESKENMLTGLYWALSLLGAELPPSSPGQLIDWKSSDLFALNLLHAGFDDHALKKISRLNGILKQSGEYQTMNGIDVGRFVMLTINSSFHYYQIAGVPRLLQDFLTERSFNKKRGLIANSGVALKNRIVRVANDSSGIGFLCVEGRGLLVDDSFKPEEYETLDVMSNGQLRYAAYDLDGKLKSAAGPHLTRAGKPAKCMWCHESRLQTLRSSASLLETELNQKEFLAIVDGGNRTIDRIRENKQTLIDYSRTQDHVLMELLYISFMEPSSRRLASEWQMPVEVVESILENHTVHQHAEFPFLGQLYDRNEIDGLAPYLTVRVPTSARELSEYEPDLLR